MPALLTGISSMATRGVLADAAVAWRAAGHGEVEIVAVGGVDAARRVRDGEAFDVVVLAGDVIGQLTAEGHILPGTQTDLVRSAVAIAVARGARRPAVDTEAALRDAVLAARSIGYSTGPSGVALQQLFQRWGIAEAIRERTVQARPGVPVGSLVARGEVALGFQQLSELMHLDGIDVIGPMPPGLEIVTTFSGGVGARSATPDAARALLEFIRSPAADAARQRHGMQPARTSA